MKAVIVLITTIIFLGAFSDPAEARRRNKREGFNFGTMVRLLNTDGRTRAGEGSDKNTHTVTRGQSVNPYMGYAFEVFNIGLIFSSENEASNTIERAEDGSTEYTRQTDSSLKGLSLYTRFLFGSVFFFEAAGGVYQEKIEVKTEDKTLTSPNAFVGERDEYTVKGIGPGYHLGAGLELPMGDGFHFSTAYQVRMVQIRDHEGGADLGRKRSTEQKREIVFGLAHYTN